MARHPHPYRSHLRSASAAAAVAGIVLVGSAVEVTARPIGPYDVGGAIEAEYDRVGGLAFFGEPLSPESAAARGGRYQLFERDCSIYWHPDTGAQQIGGAIRDKWGDLGYEGGPLGYPVTREMATPSKPGRYNVFQGGSIYWSIGTAAHQIGGSIRDKWGSYGWESSPLGFPITDETPARAGNGRYSLFGGGAIYWSPTTDAHVIWGAIRGNWEAAGAEAGRYGYPISDEYDVAEGKAQDFQGGRITWRP
ncbi:LGFP repeat-containing protein [Nocardia sp. 004]|uniref:LGFP repeat-containing protein n=1 Tax=Nocardia sp. 004 TaxID=3385978 RepID=UPI0039A24642